VLTLGKLCAQWNYLTVRIMLIASKDRDIVSSAAVDYMMYSGFVVMAYHWARMAFVAVEKLKKGNGAETPDFYRAKIETAEFYFQRILPRAKGHADAALAPSSSVMKTPIENFQML
jgi:hypothetical protein